MAEGDGLQALEREILSEAEARAGEIAAAAGERAAQVLQRAREQGASQAAHVVAEARREAARERVRSEAAAQLEARRHLLAAREAIIARVVAAARARLEGGLSPGERQEALEKALLAAAAALGGGRLTAQVAERDAPLLTPAFLERLAGRLRAQGVATELTAGQPVPINGGAVVSSDGGRIVLDNSFDARLERQAWELRNEVWQALTERVPEPELAF
ncbi:MAG TPA: V-type ATP synthase subunit E [Anaerolineae bacterium]|nr:V-type ATP synthase subunit E [Anaerolineae bacterium]HOQ99337.1 V-type ATP synthase subunit E [Anaerolineae bacterium]HPL26774.1 V-type ATP synthase subunit E [Anaerolineae bacterium]